MDQLFVRIELEKQSQRRLEINIKCAPIVRELIIHQMKDIMFYSNKQIDNVEIEPVNSKDINYLQPHSRDILLNEMRDNLS